MLSGVTMLTVITSRSCAAVKLLFKDQKKAPGLAKKYRGQQLIRFYFNPNSSMEISRILNFWILPVTVIGNASTNL